MPRISCVPDAFLPLDPPLTVLDCTLRDGGLCNQWRFSDDFVRKTLSVLAKAGVDVVEVGYRTALDPKPTRGIWGYCPENTLSRFIENPPFKIAVMMDEGRSSLTDLLPKSDSLVDIVRVATYAKDMDSALQLLEGAIRLGYETACNVMAISTCTPSEINTFLKKLSDSSVKTISVVDSYGALYPHHVRYLVEQYKNALRPDQSVGVHMHNNLQNALANTIAAIDAGATTVDATLLGMGRGSGNCPLEVLLSYLQDARFHPEALFTLLEEYADLQLDLHWGYHLPYMMTGWHNQHPKAAIEHLREHGLTKFQHFYEQISDSPAEVKPSDQILSEAANGD